MRIIRNRAAGLLACGVLLASCSAEDGATFEAKLAGAAPGDVIRLGGKTYTGNFSVPAGVEILGDGESRIIAVDGGPALRVERGSDVTRISGVRVEASGAGVLVQGEGTVRLENVSITVRTGYALAFEGGTLELSSVMLHGAIEGPEDDRLTLVGEQIDPRDISVVGLIGSNGRVEIEGLEIDGFAGFGAIFFEVNGTWRGGRVHTFVGTGIHQENSQLSIRNVTVEAGLVGRGAGFALHSLGVLAVGGGSLDTVGLSLQNLPGIGVFHDAASGTHLDLATSGLGQAGVVAQNIEFGGLEITGEGSVLGSCTGAGIFARRINGLRLIGIQIDSTAHGTGSYAVDVADGLHLVGLSGPVTLSGVTITAAERAGILFDGTGQGEWGVPSLLVSNVTIVMSDAGYGLVTQNGAPEDTSLTDGIRYADSTTREEPVAGGGGTGPDSSLLNRVPSSSLSVMESWSGLPSVGLIGTNGLIGTSGLIGTNGLFGPDFLIGTNGLIGPSG